MTELNLDKLMELYQKTALGELHKVKPFHDKIYNPEGRNIGEVEGAELLIALHNSFPAIVEQIRVMEKMVEIILKEFSAYGYCPLEFEGGQYAKCESANGVDCNIETRCINDYYHQKALAELSHENYQEEFWGKEEGK